MKKALVVVDYQNDFVSGSLGSDMAVAVEDNICKKIAECKKDGSDVIFTLDTHGENYLETEEGKKLPVAHCVKGTDGWNLYGKVAEQADGSVNLEKKAFGSVELAEYLSKKQYDTVELVGVATNVCVISNAVIAKSALPNAEISVDASCCATYDAALHQKALDVMKSMLIVVTNE